MPRQTAEKEFRIPDGFQMAVNVGDGFEDVGLLAGGATGTLNWDVVFVDAGNYQHVKKESKNFTFQLSPSALWNWNLGVLEKVFNGVLSKDGTELTNIGSNNADINTVSVRLAHFPTSDRHVLIADDITALDTDTVNEYVTVPKTAFSTSLTWSTDIDGYVSIEGRREVHVSDKNSAESQGNFYTDGTNLYFIEALGTYADLAEAKADLTGGVVEAFSTVDWSFILYNATIDSGSSFNFKGVNEDGMDEVTVGFTGQPDPDEGYRLIRMFQS